MAGEVRVRIAPSPTGDPHVGTAYIALFNKAFATQRGGKFILRVEDTDRQRSSRESEEAIFRSLRWLGLTWDEGPDAGGPCGPYRQSERVAIYRNHADELLEKGAAYRCFCTPERLAELRAEQRRRKLPQVKYDRRCLGLSEREVKRRTEAGQPHIVRLRVPEGTTVYHDRLRGAIAFQNETIDDQVLLKSDGFPTYHLANVVDDHLMGITHVCRAEEWITSTPKHVLLYRAFGWEPPEFIHMPLLRNPDRSKIGKRKNPTSLEWYRAQGYLPEALLNFLALMGYSMPDERQVFSFEELAESFSWDRVNTSGPVFDLEKLEWLNGVHIRTLPARELAHRLREADELAAGASEEQVRRIVPLVRERIKKLSDFPRWAAFFFAQKLCYDPRLLIQKKSSREEAASALRAATDALAGLGDWTAPAIEEALRALPEGLGLKPRNVFMALRVATTGATASPPLFESLEVLGRERTLKFLADALAALETLPT